MEYIKKEELIENEIYTHLNGNIVKYQYLNHKNEVCGIHIGKNQNEFVSNLSIRTDSFIITELKLSTPEEKHWLNTCIKADKFVTFEEAMKTFIPKYVKCIDSSGWNLIKKGNIYKTDAYTYSPGKYRIVFDKRDGFGGQDTGGVEHRFKPSTKKAYDAQFVVKEPEPLPQFKVIETIETITKVENNEGNQFFIGDTITPIKGFNKGNKYIISGFRYNNAKTNICAIINIHSTNGIGIDKIEHYIEPKVEIKKNKFYDFKIGDIIQLKKVTYDYNTYKIIKIVDDILFYKGNDIYTNSHRVLAKNAIKVN